MSQKKARAARQAAGPLRFELKGIENEIRDIRASETMQRREALAVEKVEIKKERAEIRRSIAAHPLRGGLSALLGRWTA